jgi:hypothetical protein
VDICKDLPLSADSSPLIAFDARLSCHGDPEDRATSAGWKGQPLRPRAGDSGFCASSPGSVVGGAVGGMTVEGLGATGFEVPDVRPPGYSFNYARPLWEHTQPFRTSADFNRDFHFDGRREFGIFFQALVFGLGVSGIRRSSRKPHD